MIDYLHDDGSLLYPPAPVLPETYADLDLMLLTATTDTQYWAALITGTHEVLDRLDHLADPTVSCGTAAHVIDLLHARITQLRHHQRPDLADWLTQLTDLLTTQQQLHTLCANQIRNATGHDAAITAISDATASLRTAAGHVSTHRFSAMPAHQPAQPDYLIMGIAIGALSAEINRNPLHSQLAGTGGAAGSAEFNPYVAALYELELATHRRLYRALYRLTEHVGINMTDDGIYHHPDDIDRQPFEKPDRSAG